jgi:hypothetical protein
LYVEIREGKSLKKERGERNLVSYNLTKKDIDLVCSIKMIFSFKYARKIRSRYVKVFGFSLFF